MSNCLFQVSFLHDTLNMELAITPNRITLTSGVQVILHQRGVLEVIPAERTQDSNNIIVSCGIHGNETAPMEIVDKIVEDILSGFQTISARCLFIIAHPAATLKHTRYLETNLNRLFGPKEHLPSVELDLAQNLKQLMDEFYQGTLPNTRWHLDLHCAIRGSKHYSFVVSPKSRHPVRDRVLFDFIGSAHIEAVLLSNAASSTFSWFSAEHYAAKALTMELGSVARLGENNLNKLTAFDLALRNLIAQSLAEHLSRDYVTYRVSRTINRKSDEFSFMFADDVENFTSFKHGEVFGHENGKPLMAKNDNEAVVFPNRNVEIGQRAALMVCKVETRFEDDQLVYD